MRKETKQFHFGKVFLRKNEQTCFEHKNEKIKKVINFGIAIFGKNLNHPG